MNSRYSKLLMMFLLLGVYNFVQSADAVVDWAAFYKRLPVAQQDEQEGDDGDSDSSWGTSSSSSSDSSSNEGVLEGIKDRADFDIVVQNLKAYQVWVASTSQFKYAQRAMRIQAKSRANAIIQKSKVDYPDIQKFVDAAVADPNYEEVRNEIDNSDSEFSEEAFLGQKESIVAAYAQCKTVEEAQNFLDSYVHEGKNMSAEQKEEVKGGIISSEELEAKMGQLVNGYKRHGDDFLNGYKNDRGQILSFVQKEKIKNYFMSPEKFEAIKNEILEHYLSAPIFGKEMFFNKGFGEDDKRLLPSQIKQIKDLAKLVPADLLRHIVVKSLLGKSRVTGAVSSDKVERVLRGLGVLDQVANLSEFTAAVNQEIVEKIGRRRDYDTVLQKSVDNFVAIDFSGFSKAQLTDYVKSTGLEGSILDFDEFYQQVLRQVTEKSRKLKADQEAKQANSPYLLPEIFDKVKGPIIDLCKEFAKYPGARAVVLKEGSRNGKSLSPEQQAFIEASLDFDGVEQIETVQEQVLPPSKKDFLKERYTSLMSVCRSWNVVMLPIWKNRFVLGGTRSGKADIPIVYVMLNNYGIQRYLSSSQSNDLSDERFEELKNEIFAVYKVHKNNELFLNINLRPLLGGKQLTSAQIAQLNAMMAGGSAGIDIVAWKRKAANLKRIEVPNWQMKIRREMGIAGATEAQIREVLGTEGTSTSDSGGHASSTSSSSTSSSSGGHASSTSSENGRNSASTYQAASGILRLNQVLQLVAVR